MNTGKILVTGSNGQIGQILVRALQTRYGKETVLASDIRSDDDTLLLDVTERAQLKAIVLEHNVKQIYHLAAVLSATGEKNPPFAWGVNMRGLLNVLDVSLAHHVEKVFFPSSIAVFGDYVNRVKTAQHSILEPDTVYGISKVAGEHWAKYYHKHYGLDVRSVRYPGIIGHESLPGGGTTDYAVHIFHAAIKEGHYECFLEEDARLPMMYMPDAIRATIELMEAPAEALSIRTSYNLQGMSFTPAELAAAIQTEIPSFTIRYKPDFRQAIAASWPEALDDADARADWNWQPQYDLPAMVKDMLLHLREQLAVNSLYKPQNRKI
jgi:threonine 3-dehydrogenase